VVRDVSKEGVAFFFKGNQSIKSIPDGVVTLEDEGDTVLRNVESPHPATQRHIPEDANCQNRYKEHRLRNVFVSNTPI
jgi:hypothetical protein